LSEPDPHRGAQPSSLRLYSLIVLMVLFWAMNFLIGKVALREIPPLLLGGMRVSLAGALILPVYLWMRRRDPVRMSWSRDELPRFLFLGLMGVAVNQLSFVIGLHNTSVAHSSILMSQTPLFVLLLAGIVGQERVTGRRVAGMLTAIGGVAVLSVAPAKTSGASLFGDAWILMAALSFALFTVFGKQITARHGSVTVNMFAYVGGAVMLSPLTLWYARDFSFAQVSVKAWLSFVYMAVFPSLVCYLIFYYALTYIPASRVSAFSYLQPLLATSAAALIFGEPVTAGLVTGGALVLTGVFLAERA
jgi:drug/metabolite transporter (DMT)-like permease